MMSHGCVIFVVIVAFAVGFMLGFSVSFEPPSYPQETITTSVSGYCLCSKCCGKWASVFPRVTASGHVIKPGDKLAAHKTLPFGTVIEVPGYGRCEIQDRFPGDGIDLLFWEWNKEAGEKYEDALKRSHNLALRWGRQKLKVTVSR